MNDPTKLSDGQNKMIKVSPISNQPHLCAYGLLIEVVLGAAATNAIVSEAGQRRERDSFPALHDDLYSFVDKEERELQSTFRAALFDARVKAMSNNNSDQSKNNTASASSSPDLILLRFRRQHGTDEELTIVNTILRHSLRAAAAAFASVSKNSCETSCINNSSNNNGGEGMEKEMRLILDLERCNLVDADVNVFAPLARRTSSLLLAGNKITARGLKRLLDMFVGANVAASPSSSSASSQQQQYYQLAHLGITSNPLGAAGLAVLTAALPRMVHLEKLHATRIGWLPKEKGNSKEEQGGTTDEKNKANNGDIAPGLLSLEGLKNFISACNALPKLKVVYFKQNDIAAAGKAEKDEEQQSNDTVEYPQKFVIA